MLESEIKYEVALGSLSPYAIGDIVSVCQITDYYLAPEPLGDASTPTCRIRTQTDGRGSRVEITIKRPTSDPITREEYTYPVPAGSVAVGPEVPRVSKVRYRLRALRGVLAGVIGGRIDLGPRPTLPEGRTSPLVLDLLIPDSVICTLDVFSHPHGEPAVLELEGPPETLRGLGAELAARPWLVPRGPGAPSTADRARPLR